jgi:phenylphosphate carboxylase alpha subunit
MAAKDNRDFIEALKESGDVVVVNKEVDWDLEAGAIARHASEQEGPAILFEKIKDYPDGYRIFATPVGTYRRVAVALGLPADTPTKKIYEVYEQRAENPIAPRVVEEGPCKENIMLGDEVDLYHFPTPMCHDGDGGRYIGTWGFVVCKDPDSDWVNWGMYRFHINSQRSLAMSPAPGSNLGALFRQKFMPQNRPMPIAAVVGADPLCSIASSAGHPVGQSEVFLAGGLHQEPVELVRCETNDLMVPAHSEVVIEGEILPDMSAAEGPFGEYPGYRSPGFEARLYCRVKGIGFRNSPILTMSNLGVPPDDSHVGGCISISISLKNRLQRKGLPVLDVYQNPEGAAFMLIVRVSEGGPDVVKGIADSVGIRRAWISKIVVVDEDVDAFDMRQVIHALAVKCDPATDILVKETPPGTGNPFSPLVSVEELKTLKGSMAYFDCTWDPERPKDELPLKSSFDSIFPEEIRKKVLANWSKYGF